MSVEVTVNWQPALNVCRCCLNDCCYKDISTEYYWMGQKEVYADMLSEVFGLTISYQDIGPGSSNRLICEDCITRLRDATTFKKQVIESEKNFLLHIQKRRSQTNNVTVPDEKVDLKVECPKSEEEPESSDDGFDQDIGALDDDSDCVDVKVEQIYEVKEEEEEPVKKPPKRKTTTKAYTRRKRPKLSDTAEETNDEPSSSKKNKSRRLKASKTAYSRRRVRTIRENTIRILEHSNICLFDWNKTNYRCFCCKETFLNITELRQHSTKHTLCEIEKKMKSINNLRVKAEISQLECKICSEPFSDIETLKEHLRDTHNVTPGSETNEDLFKPFKLNDVFQCEICSDTFEAFRTLNVHMNTHYLTHICDACGVEFSNNMSLRNHKRQIHVSVKCEECNVDFANAGKKNRHDIKIHKKIQVKRRLCAYCPEVFANGYKLELHIINVHKVNVKEYKCKFCDKTFTMSRVLRSHTKLVHLKERKRECEICQMKFFTNHDLNRHKITHTKEKNFQCNICSTRFTTRDSLRKHIKRFKHDLQ